MATPKRVRVPVSSSSFGGIAFWAVAKKSGHSFSFLPYCAGVFFVRVACTCVCVCVYLYVCVCIWVCALWCSVFVTAKLWSLSLDLVAKMEASKATWTDRQTDRPTDRRRVSKAQTLALCVKAEIES